MEAVTNGDGTLAFAPAFMLVVNVLTGCSNANVGDPGDVCSGEATFTRIGSCAIS